MRCGLLCRLASRIRSLCCAALCVVAVPACAAEFTAVEAAAALRRAVAFFRTTVAVEGGYVYRVSEDLTKREGEERVTPTQVWIEPPATPSIGEAYLEAYTLTGEPYLLDAACETAECLRRGQLRSGGWCALIEFEATARAREYDFRLDPPGDPTRPKNLRFTTIDDNKTQACLKFLMRLDAATDFRDQRLHEAVSYALEAVVAAQYPNGAWPQQFAAPPNPSDFPVVKANYPKSWSRTFPGGSYIAHYTFNDNAIADVIGVMLEASVTYAEPRYRAAAERGGDFIRLAQMPEPQPAWAQQYDAAMHPTWARKFEPPSISSRESQGVIRILLALHQATGERRFLEPIPAALAYLRRSLRPDGRFARFYELHTNRPLYFTKSYALSYSDADLPTHYGFITLSRLDELQAAYDMRVSHGPTTAQPATPRSVAVPPTLTPSLAAAARQAASALDERGAWVTPGRLRAHGDDPTNRVIESRVFIRNMLTLARCAAAR